MTALAWPTSAIGVTSFLRFFREKYNDDATIATRRRFTHRRHVQSSSRVTVEDGPRRQNREFGSKMFAWAHLTSCTLASVQIGVPDGCLSSHPVFGESPVDRENEGVFVLLLLPHRRRTGSGLGAVLSGSALGSALSGVQSGSRTSHNSTHCPRTAKPSSVAADLQGVLSRYRRFAGTECSRYQSLSL